MRKRIIAALSLACLTSGNLLAGEIFPTSPAGAVENISIVLDCSRSMGESLAPRISASEQGETRFEAARGALSQLLKELSATGTHRVTLCLFGHRLALETVEERTLTRPQQQYLEAAGAIEEIKDLTASEDVEILGYSGRLTAAKADGLASRLERARPWGENPLYLSLCRAIDLQPEGMDLSNHRIVVITDGMEHGEDADAPTSLIDVLKGLQDRHVSVQVISLDHSGSDADRDSTRKLQQIARQSGGQVHYPRTLAELKESLRLAVSRTQSEVAVTGNTEAAPPVEGAPPVEPAPVVPVVPLAVDPAEEGHKVRISIKYYKEIVRGAKVVLRSVNGDTDAAKFNKATGDYEFSALQEGEYLLEVNAVIRNKVYQTSRPVIVDGVPDAPLKFLITFE